MQQWICAHSCCVCRSQLAQRTSRARCLLKLGLSSHNPAYTLARAPLFLWYGKIARGRERQKAVKGAQRQRASTMALYLLCGERHALLARHHVTRGASVPSNSFSRQQATAPPAIGSRLLYTGELSWLLRRADYPKMIASAAVPRRGPSVNSAARAQNTNNDKSHDNPSRRPDRQWPPALKQAFDSAKDDGRASLVGYLTGRLPGERGDRRPLLLALEKGGSGVIELRRRAFHPTPWPTARPSRSATKYFTGRRGSAGRWTTR